MGLLRPFKTVPRNIREWSRWFGTLSVEADSVGDGVVGLAGMADIATDSFIGRETAGTGVPEVLPASIIETVYNAQVAAASQAEAEAGTETEIRRFSPLRIAQAIAAQWTLKVADFTLVAGDMINATAIATAIDATLPGTIAAGNVFIVHNASTSTKVVQIDPATHSILGAAGTVTSSDTLVLALGETVYMVAISTSVLEVV